jgi:hypothetical protein
MIPVLLGRTREHQDAIRSARGDNLGAELATSCALAAGAVVLLFIVAGLLLSG